MSLRSLYPPTAVIHTVHLLLSLVAATFSERVSRLQVAPHRPPFTSKLLLLLLQLLFLKHVNEPDQSAFTSLGISSARLNTDLEVGGGEKDDRTGLKAFQSKESSFILPLSNLPA